MASLFAFSASVQFNDSDWYFWFPLYATASVVNLVNWVSRNANLGGHQLWAFLCLLCVPKKRNEVLIKQKA
ncbi:hypothetical protein F0562_003840 [Nyssa sinensis]|uniref:Uncharacterized protein n=1 Tax=Nyssa sinensis TaxID=561372 RepID=A0A5J5BXE9_9ASTE|nr:hypothetical protein F0562_003840 [Nyssa sinensis]